MARKGSKDRGVTFKDGVWWVRLYVNGREKWYRCQTKSQAKALYGRLKADQREDKYFSKEKRFPFQLIASDYETAVDTTRHGRIGDDHARIKWWISVFKDQDASGMLICLLPTSGKLWKDWRSREPGVKPGVNLSPSHCDHRRY